MQQLWYMLKMPLCDFSITISTAAFPTILRCTHSGRGSMHDDSLSFPNQPIQANRCELRTNPVFCRALSNTRLDVQSCPCVVPSKANDEIHRKPSSARKQRSKPRREKSSQSLDVRNLLQYVALRSIICHDGFRMYRVLVLVLTPFFFFTQFCRR